MTGLRFCLAVVIFGQLAYTNAISEDGSKIQQKPKRGATDMTAEQWIDSYNPSDPTYPEIGVEVLAQWLAHVEKLYEAIYEINIDLESKKTGLAELTSTFVKDTWGHPGVSDEYKTHCVSIDIKESVTQVVSGVDSSMCKVVKQLPHLIKRISNRSLKTKGNDLKKLWKSLVELVGYDGTDLDFTSVKLASFNTALDTLCQSGDVCDDNEELIQDGNIEEEEAELKKELKKLMKNMFDRPLNLAESAALDKRRDEILKRLEEIAQERKAAEEAVKKAKADVTVDIILIHALQKAEEEARESGDVVLQISILERQRELWVKVQKILTDKHDAIQEFIDHIDSKLETLQE